VASRTPPYRPALPPGGAGLIFSEREERSMHSHVQRIVRVAAAALVVAPALALAQTGPLPPGQRNPRNPPTPTPAPTTPGAPTATPPGQMPGGESAEQVTQTLQSLRSLDAMVIQAGTLASQRAHNAKLKSFGSKLASDHKKIDEGLVKFANQRKLGLGAQAQMKSEDSSTLQKLQGAQGSDFDREFSDEAVNAHMQYVQQLKDMRDKTPGKDPELKKWLDDTENVEEAHLTEARQIREQMRQESRQARTPAKK
jgi:putative membrane protein